MEFKAPRNIESEFKQIRMYVIAFAVLCSGVSIFAADYTYYFTEKQRGKIYVLGDSKSLMLMLSRDEKVDRPVKAKEHMRRFHELFFSLIPNKKAIEDSTERAFFMADRPAFNCYRDLAERGYYNRIISGNILQRVIIDSMRCNFNSYPYQVETLAKQFVTRTSNITEKSLITSCRLISSVRSDNNPQGFIIEQFNVMGSKDLRTVER